MSSSQAPTTLPALLAADGFRATLGAKPFLSRCSLQQGKNGQESRHHDIKGKRLFVQIFFT